MYKRVNIPTEDILKMRAKGVSIEAIAHTYGVHITTIYKRLRNLKDTYIAAPEEPKKVSEENCTHYKPLPTPSKVVVTDISDWKKAREEDLCKAIIMTILNKSLIPIEWIDEYNSYKEKA